MKLRTWVKQALQSCALIARSGVPLTTSFLSEVCGFSGEYVAKTLHALARTEVLVGTPVWGEATNSVEARDITVLEILEVIEGPSDSFRPNGRQRSISGSRNRAINLRVGRLVAEADAAWQPVLARSSIEDLVV